MVMAKRGRKSNKEKEALRLAALKEESTEAHPVLEKPKSTEETPATAPPAGPVPNKFRYHPCSWCGGFKVPGNELEQIEIGMKVNAPIAGFVRKNTSVKLAEQKQPFIACSNCLFKLFNNLLGSTNYYGKELAYLKSDEKTVETTPKKKPLFG
jgi:hypothetical protein